MCGCLSHAPYWGPGLQPRCVPWLGTESTEPYRSGQKGPKLVTGPHPRLWALRRVSGCPAPSPERFRAVLSIWLSSAAIVHLHCPAWVYPASRRQLHCGSLTPELPPTLGKVSRVCVPGEGPAARPAGGCREDGDAAEGAGGVATPHGWLSPGHRDDTLVQVGLTRSVQRGCSHHGSRLGLRTATNSPPWGHGTLIPAPPPQREPHPDSLPV